MVEGDIPHKHEAELGRVMEATLEKSDGLIGIKTGNIFRLRKKDFP